jgi:hypothetical protein
MRFVLGDVIAAVSPRRWRVPLSLGTGELSGDQVIEPLMTTKLMTIASLKGAAVRL